MIPSRYRWGNAAPDAGSLHPLKLPGFFMDQSLMIYRLHREFLDTVGKPWSYAHPKSPLPYFSLLLDWGSFYREFPSFELPL